MCYVFNKLMTGGLNKVTVHDTFPFIQEVNHVTDTWKTKIRHIESFNQSYLENIRLLIIQYYLLL